MDFMWSYITDCLQNAESSMIFEDLWSKDKDLRFEDKDL